MNVNILKEIAKHFREYKKISYISRIGDNMLKLVLDSRIFYIDLAKGRSNIFCSDEINLSSKNYQAPFDIALQKYCLKANVLDCNIDGNNRILRFYLQKPLQYKLLDSILQLEFTGKYTNAIILDSSFIILEALHKIATNSRIVKNGIVLEPLPQQTNIKEVALDMPILEFLYQNNLERQNKDLDNAKASAIKSLQTKLEKLKSNLLKLENKEELESRSAKYAKVGELLQNSSSIKIEHNKISLIGYDGVEQSFELDFDIQESKNLINEFFTKSKKLKAKAQNISLQRENLLENIAFMESKIDFISKARSINDIAIIMQKIVARKQNARQNSKIEKAKYESFFIEGIKVSIGKNKNENIALLKDARANDIWMHIKDIPSSHLIIHSNKSNIKQEILQKAGEILVSFLKVKSGNFLVDYTLRKFVKIKEGANVVYSNYHTLIIKN